MAEVRGSSPLGSTLFFYGFAGKTHQGAEGPALLPAPFDDSLTTVEAALREYIFHRTRGKVSHSWDYVGIGIQRDRHSGVAQESLNEPGVCVAA